MSMKSFDKFCERLILAEPGSEREVYDERQKVMQMKISINALTIFALASFVFAFIDKFAKWSESLYTVLSLIGALCLSYFQIHCAAKGCLIPISGKLARKITAIFVIVTAALNMLRYIYDIGEETYFIKDGLVSDDVLFAASFLLLIINGIFLLCMIRRDDKKNGGAEE